MNSGVGRCIARVAACVAVASSLTLRSEKLNSQYRPVLSQAQVQAILESVSGETARDHIRVISQYWRWAPSRGFHEVGEYVVAKAKSYGLEDAHIERFLADRNSSYLGARLYRPSWDPLEGELWLVEPRRQKVTSFADVPMALAGYSRNADVTAELVDVGEGTSPEDYAGKDVRGKIVLGTGNVGILQLMAVFERGALGVLSAWTPEHQTSRDALDNPDAVTWGNRALPESRTGQPSTFGFMLSRRQHKLLVTEIEKSPKVMVRAMVRAELTEPGYMEVVTATIPGRECPEQEVVFSAHLEHPRPSANDNASGSAVLLEIARVLSQIVKSGQLPRTKRTVRFLWVQEGRSTRAYLDQHLESAKKAIANINMDIVGSDQEKTKAILYLWQSPASRPSFISDLVQDYFEMVRRTNNDRMPTEPLDPILSPTGNRRPFVGSVERYRRPSDQSNFIGIGVPAVNFAAWPDQFHHTPFDTPEKSDPTQLQRVAFIGAASAAAVVIAAPKDALSILPSVVGRARQRIGEDLTKALRLVDRRSSSDVRGACAEARNVVHQGLLRELGTIDSLKPIWGTDKEVSESIERQKTVLQQSEEHLMQSVNLHCQESPPRPRSQPTPASARANRVPTWLLKFGPDPESLMEFFRERGVDLNALRISQYTWEIAEPTALFNATIFEALNFIDNRRTVQEIRDAVSAEFDPVPLEVIEEFIEAMERGGIVGLK